MKFFNIKDTFKGWFVGNFPESILQTTTCELAYKTYKAGDCESKHFHAIANEVTLIITGKCTFFLSDGKSIELVKGQIILIEPNETVMFLANEDTETVVLKIPSVIGDKYLT